MKQISEELRQFKLQHHRFNQAELFTLTLRNGLAINATTWPLDIPSPDIVGLTYSATKYGMWSHGKTTSEMMFSLSSQSCDLQVAIPNAVSPVNLVPDSDGTYGTWSTQAGLPYSLTGGQFSGGAWTYTGTGSPSSFLFSKSQVFNVVPGQQYILSGYIDATHVTSIVGGGTPVWAVEDPTVTTGYAAASQAIGTAGRVSSAPFTVPAGVTQVRVIMDTDNCTVASGQPLIFSEPQLELGPTATFYQSTNNLFLFPGTQTNLLQTAAMGLFDGADVVISRCYGPIEKILPDLTLGVEVIQAGRITNIAELNRAYCRFNVNDYLFLANQNIPANLVQTNCHHTLFDTDGRIGCKILKASFAVTVTAAAGSSASNVQLSATLGHAAPYYDQGVLTGLTGQNAGLSQTVNKQISGTALQMVVPFLFPVAAGDTFTLAPGCDKTLATCKAKFSNGINFGGKPLVPPPESVL